MTIQFTGRYRQNDYVPDYKLDPPFDDDCPECPVCHENCERFVTDKGNNVIGCENCMPDAEDEMEDARDYLNDKDEMARAWAEEQAYQSAWERSRDDG